jgi:hypothetical protein
MKKLRNYDVTFENLRTGCTRTVQVTTTDSVNAARIVYANFGGKKIKVTSAKVVKDEQTD